VSQTDLVYDDWQNKIWHALKNEEMVLWHALPDRAKHVFPIRSSLQTDGVKKSDASFRQLFSWSSGPTLVRYDVNQQ
jgi:hypothetical protein